jgi:glycine cleavage system H protein
MFIMDDYLEFQVGKFIFKVATDRLYSEEGMWVRRVKKQAEVGISDYLQQRSGDVAFAEIKPTEIMVNTGDELVVIETIKVNISLTSPVTGKVIEVNPAMETAPEVINQDPYGAGWLVKIELAGVDDGLKNLLSPQEYFEKTKNEAEQEVKKE